MDVKTLYTNIPNNEGITIVKRKHDNYTKKLLDNMRPLHMQTYLCPSSKRDTSILSLKTNPGTICAISTIFLWHGPSQRTNLNSL